MEKHPLENYLPLLRKQLFLDSKKILNLASRNQPIRIVKNPHTIQKLQKWNIP
jgi:hypothetical protein